ncbi:MAG TPA: hypothetical protein VHX86_03470 [Tepidisphaeraceae bacterium]|nr:hypothetical protein [Tepidisphaeraceae bacterium]
MDQAADVVADDFAENFTDHRHVGFSADVIAEFGLYHREHGLDIATLVVVAQKIFAARTAQKARDEGIRGQYRHKISRGTFPATFLLAALKTIEVDTVRLESV